MGALSRLNVETLERAPTLRFDRFVRCSAHGRSFARLRQDYGNHDDDDERNLLPCSVLQSWQLPRNSTVPAHCCLGDKPPMPTLTKEIRGERRDGRGNRKINRTLNISVKHLGYLSETLNTSMHPPVYSYPILFPSALYLPQLAAGKRTSCNNHTTVTWPLCTVIHKSMLTVT